MDHTPKQPSSRPKSGERKAAPKRDRCLNCRQQGERICHFGPLSKGCCNSCRDKSIPCIDPPSIADEYPSSSHDKADRKEAEQYGPRINQLEQTVGGFAQQHAIVGFLWGSRQEEDLPMGEKMQQDLGPCLQRQEWTQAVADLRKYGQPVGDCEKDTGPLAPGVPLELVSEGVIDIPRSANPGFQNQQVNTRFNNAAEGFTGYAQDPFMNDSFVAESLDLLDFPDMMNE